MVALPKLHKLLLRAFVGPFLASFSVAVFILALQFVVKYQDHLFGKGFGVGIILQMLGLAVVQMTVLALPIAILVGSLMTMGNLGERYELAAIKTSGISLFRIMRPLIAAAIALALFSLWFSWIVVPASNLRLYSLVYDIKRAKPELALEPGYFENKITGYTLYFANRNPVSGYLQDIKLWEHDPSRGNFKTISADSARMTVDNETLYLRLTLFDGNVYEQLRPEKTGSRSVREAIVAFDSSYQNLDLSGFGLSRTDEGLFKGHRYMLTVPELVVAIDSLDSLTPGVLDDIKQQTDQYYTPERLLTDSLYRSQEPEVVTSQTAALEPAPENVLALFPASQHGPILRELNGTLRNLDNQFDWLARRYAKHIEEVNRYRIEYHLKFALPVAVLVFLFIGAPLGAIVRKGGLGMPVVVGIGFFILFYILLTQGRKMAQEAYVEAWIGTWLPVFVLAPAAVYLTYQASLDARLFDLSAYRIWWDKVRERFKGAG